MPLSHSIEQRAAIANGRPVPIAPRQLRGTLIHSSNNSESVNNEAQNLLLRAMLAGLRQMAATAHSDSPTLQAEA